MILKNAHLRVLNYGKNDGSNLRNTVKCLQAKGIDAIGMCFYWSNIQNYEGILSYKKNQFLQFYFRFFYEVWKADLIHIWSSNLIPFTLWWIKLLRKPHVIEHTGGDIRNPELDGLKPTYYGESKERALKNQKPFKNVINISSSHILINHLVNPVTKYIGHRLYLPDYKFNPTVHNPLRVCHATSNREAKGTELVLEAVKDLPITFTLIENMPFEECKKIMNDNDIVIGQMYWGEHGMNEMEASAMGKPVLCYIKHDEETPCEEIDKDDIAGYIKRNCMKPKILDKLSRCARVECKIMVNTAVNALLTTYNEALSPSVVKYKASLKKENWFENNYNENFT